MISPLSKMRSQIDELATLARRLLPSMLDEQTGLYAQKVVWDKIGPQAKGSSRLYSAMSAIGISRDTQRGSLETPNTTLGSLHALALEGPSTTGELAATIWALAEAGDDRADQLLRLFIPRFKPSASSTMELGLVLAASAAAIDAFASAGVVARPATAAADELLARFSSSANLFRGSASALRPRQKLQARMTSFASQVYPMLGLVEFARATGTTPPAQVTKAADRLVELQGPLGEWWWIYSSKTGAVLEGHPVYSVHQHAMAFMALAPLQNLQLGTYSSDLARGLQWIFGDNELKTPVVDFGHDMVARCIQRIGSDADGPLGLSVPQWRKVVLSSLGLRSVRPPATENDLEILWECRPYELGWLLYARSLINDW
jgi:hypothetical protein